MMKLGPFGVAPESETPGWTHRRIKCVLPGDSLSVEAGPFLTVEMRESETDTDIQTQTQRPKHRRRLYVRRQYTRVREIGARCRRGGVSRDDGGKSECENERREGDGVMKLGPFGVAPESETPGWTHRRIKCVLPGDSLSVKAGSFLTVEIRERERQTEGHRHRYRHGHGHGQGG